MMQQVKLFSTMTGFDPAYREEDARNELEKQINDWLMSSSFQYSFFSISYSVAVLWQKNLVYSAMVHYAK
jgi:hypothetical protein